MDRRIYGDDTVPPGAAEIAERMIAYAETACAGGTPVHHITRHMMGLFHGRPGARAWRQRLTAGAARPGAGPDAIRAALDAVLALPESGTRAAA